MQEFVYALTFISASATKTDHARCGDRSHAPRHVLAAFPFYWMLITAFKTNADLYNVTNIPFWFNKPPTIEHFRYLFDETLFGRWLLNSLIIGGCVVAITLVTAIPAGYR